MGQVRDLPLMMSDFKGGNVVKKLTQKIGHP